MRKLSEKTLQRQILEYLKTVCGCWCIKTVVTNERGVPDILVCYHGRFLALEVKSMEGRPSILQLAQMRRINSAGGVAYVVKSLEDVKHIVKGIQNPPA
jgi:Holliday junction resolvase